MTLIKNILPFILILMMNCTGFAQKQRFDAISFNAPKGWQQQQNEGGIQLSVTDQKTGAYAVAVITKATASHATANENFNNDWLKLVKSSVPVGGNPAMQQPEHGNGWQIVSGTASFKDRSNNGLATLITATGNGQKLSVVLMTNTQQYQNELLAFINSLELTKLATTDKTITNNTGNLSATGLPGRIWEGTTPEKFSNAGGTSYNTGGFFTSQYRFNADGTYRFVNVLASHYTNTKTLGCETGTYAVSGNQLTIVPLKGYNDEWSKTGKTSNGNSDVTNRAINDTWGKKLKTTTRKLEQVTYTFSIGKNGDKTALVLKYNGGHTEREGNGNQTWLNETYPERSVTLPNGFNQ